MIGKRQDSSARRRGWTGPFTLRAASLGVLGLLVLLGAASLLAAIAGLFLFGTVSSRSVTVSSRSMTVSMGTSTPTFAFPGLLLRVARPRADATGWRPLAVMVGKTGTIVISVGSSASASTSGSSGQPSVLLSDSAGRSIAQSTLDLGDSGYRPTGPSQVYATFSFAPLPAGTTFVRVKHNVPGGGTTLIPINLSGLNRLPAPLTLNATRASGRVRVRFIRVVRGASLSEMDLEAQGFGDPGGEISTTTQGNTTTQTMRPPQIPDNVTLRTATGVDLLPEVGPGSVSHGVVKASIGFKTPLSGTMVTLTIDNYVLQDGPLSVRTTHGRWSVTFRMP